MVGRPTISKTTVGYLTEAHIQRIREELITAGVTPYGLRKFASHYMYRVIHPYEHVRAAVYGRYGTKGFLTSMNEGMLVATDRRVIFLDYKPGFTDLKEFTYDVVSGVERITTGLFSSVILYTRIGNFRVNFANSYCVKRFMEYIELRRLESERQEVRPSTPDSTMNIV